MSDETTPERRVVEVSVEPGDPHNDQMAAMSDEDLDRHIGSARKMLATATTEDRPAAMAAIATALIDSEDDDGTEVYSRERLASVLAAALLRLAVAHDVKDGMFGPGIFGTGIDLTQLDDDTAWRLGIWQQEQIQAAERRGAERAANVTTDEQIVAAEERGYGKGYERGRTEALNGWASLPENVRMLITDASIELQRCAENDVETERFLEVWQQHRMAVLQGRFGRYALKTDGSGVDTGDGAR